MIPKTVKLKGKYVLRHELGHFFYKFCPKHVLLRYTRIEQVTLDMRSEMRVGLSVKRSLCGPIFIRTRMFVHRCLLASAVSRSRKSHVLDWLYAKGETLLQLLGSINYKYENWSVNVFASRPWFTTSCIQGVPGGM